MTAFAIDPTPVTGTTDRVRASTPLTPGSYRFYAYFGSQDANVTATLTLRRNDSGVYTTIGTLTNASEPALSTSIDFTVTTLGFYELTLRTNESDGAGAAVLLSATADALATELSVEDIIEDAVDAALEALGITDPTAVEPVQVGAGAANSDDVFAVPPREGDVDVFVQLQVQFGTSIEDLTGATVAFRFYPPPGRDSFDVSPTVTVPTQGIARYTVPNTTTLTPAGRWRVAARVTLASATGVRETEPRSFLVRGAP